MSWQPIATAPTDGTKVDLWLHIYASPRSMGMSDSFRVVDVYYRDGKWLHFDDGKEKELYPDYITHWMQSPAPPPPTPPTDSDTGVKVRDFLRIGRLLAWLSPERRTM